jgi:hypothetical protein
MQAAIRNKYLTNNLKQTELSGCCSPFTVPSAIRGMLLANGCKPDEPIIYKTLENKLNSYLP